MPEAFYRFSAWASENVVAMAVVILAFITALCSQFFLPKGLHNLSTFSLMAIWGVILVIVWFSPKTKLKERGPGFDWCAAIALDTWFLATAVLFLEWLGEFNGQF